MILQNESPNRAFLKNTFRMGFLIANPLFVCDKWELTSGQVAGCQENVSQWQ